LQRVLRNVRQLPKLTRGRMPRKKKPAGAMDGPAGVKAAGCRLKNSKPGPGMAGLA
jgi:hypothetical protein